MIRWIVVVVLLLAAALTPFSCRRAQVRIGSKKFTESVTLGEMLTLLAQSADKHVIHHRELGGTKLVYEGLKTGDLDAYVDYTGTIRQEILAEENLKGAAALRRRLQEDGILVSDSLGFDNAYRLGMKRARAEELNIDTISDLKNHPELRFGFSNEFLDRQDGWKPLKRHYGLPQTNVRGLDHDIAYRQLDSGAIDVLDTYKTDAKIRMYDIKLLKDDRNFFPDYNAVILYRADLADRFPKVVESLLRLVGTISDDQMRTMNLRVVAEGNNERNVAADFLKRQFGLTSDVEEDTTATRLRKHTLEHIDLVRKSLLPAILLAIPLGILAAKRRRAGQLVLSAVGIVQTIPALALLVFLIAPVSWLGLSSIGQGSITAVAALFLYSLLPIVRNTYAGLNGIAAEVHESAVALGMPPAARLRLIELPMASRTILEGIKTAAVINVGFATLGALIGAGGYGQPILTGIRLNNTGLILEGAVPAAVLALVIQWSFDFGERFLVPRGLRLEGESA